jgi:hypothetical protein
MKVKCKSGVTGWRMKLQKSYANFEDWRSWSTTYSLATRLGFSGAKAAWKANPLIEGSPIPSDFRVVKPDRISRTVSVEQVVKKLRKIGPGTETFKDINDAVLRVKYCKNSTVLFFSWGHTRVSYQRNGRFIVTETFT